MTIGELAKASGVAVETIRFYEKRGLLEAPPRRASGYRDYEGAVLLRLRFIRRAKDLGFTLREVQDLLALRLDRKGSCAKVKARTEDKIADIETRLRSLRRIKRVLQKLSAACEAGEAPSSECPILEALEGG